MDYRALISSALLSIGADPDLVHEIESGADIYGDAGLLDSVDLVSLIAAIEEALTNASNTPVNLFCERDISLLEEFRDANTLVSFLERRASGNAETSEVCFED